MHINYSVKKDKFQSIIITLNKILKIKHTGSAGNRYVRFITRRNNKLKTNRAAVDHLRARVASCHGKEKKKKKKHSELKSRCTLFPQKMRQRAKNVERVAEKKKPRRFPKGECVSSHFLRSRAHASFPRTLFAVNPSCFSKVTIARRGESIRGVRINPGATYSRDLSRAAANKLGI